ncbi:chromosome segregation protein SMC [Clostridium sp. DJ247]|uniref:chromosome segregation protein SMC n=1 Tax=Clostridium sp. DJ247 TaxID=2726188 RepID=UPI001628460A|nr:chromosome segregation protein SMC [Clostridium sp. DJ247]MBC2578948.1 chromosome segregation protein SMC [Clostridium sp. DJ247]
MYLKSIEVRGFKSFADKTELIFKNGVTAIVGPNGSGKSNVSDAVRWVLGEQSVKSLRGGKMEDVIFAGTQFRKPVGLCQVSLTLDNQDKKLPLEYTDVTISRRLYRSGDSEYYINNTQCRLKDIHELFMDTGIGKEGYSIIGQGKIEAVLSGRPEERRSLLEEAAGIVKFKWRKEEAQKRLENTEANLVRIDDILGTYEERLEPLRIENEKAKKFVKLSEELKGKEINVVIYSIKNVQESIDKIEGSINALNINNEELNCECSELKNRIQLLNKNFENESLRADNYKKQYYDNKSRKQQMQSETKLLGERLENLNKFILKNSKELDEITYKLDTALSTKSIQDKEISILREKQKEINKQIVTFEDDIKNATLDISDKDHLIKNLKNDQIEYLSIISNLKNNIAIVKNDIQLLKEKADSIKNSCESYVHSIKINSSTKDAFLAQIEHIKVKIQELEHRIKNNKQQICGMTNNLSDKENQLRQLTNNQSKLEASHNMLVNLDKQYEGYNRAVKTLMNDVSKGKTNIDKESCFVLGEVIHVEKNLEIAIEIALGGAISDIITSDENIAKTLIKYLKDNNIGRATFLPLTIVKGKKALTSKGIDKLNGYVGIASELIGYDKIFTNAIEYILGRTIICTDMNSALNIAKYSNYSLKIVTLSGEVVNPGGSLTGGSLYNKGTNIIGRKREIEELSIKIKDNSENINNLNSEIQSYRKNIKLLDEENLNLKDEIYHENIEITKIKGKINTIDSESEKLRETLKISNNEIDLINEKVNHGYKDLKEKEEQLEKLSNKQKENDNLIVELEDTLKYKSNEIEAIKEKFTETKIKRAKIDENVLSKSEALNNINNTIDELKQKQAAMSVENKSSQEDIYRCKLQIQHNEDQLINIEKLILDMEEKIKEQDVEIIKIKEKIKIDTERLESINLVINKKEEQLHKEQVALAKTTTEKEALYTKLNEELEITYAEALEYKVDIQNIDDYKKDIISLKNNISSLGVVNLGAIDEYKDLIEKVNFMSAQREDLVKAKQELTDVINEMTEKMKIVFNENFNKLRKNFNETFNELFKGGSADLILTNGDELTGNIDITVQPPGKKLQNINLMSGGEKGLSAIALLFAILKMKPTPFCILDEIEAALDDANVSRYAEFLKKFSENIQFIVITHRKGTMEASDALYGITMEEKGISKVVSVDFSKEAS